MISLFGKTFFSQHTHASGEWSVRSLRIVHARFVVFMILMCTDMLPTKVKRPLLSLPPYTQKKKTRLHPRDIIIMLKGMNNTKEELEKRKNNADLCIK